MTLHVFFRVRNKFVIHKKLDTFLRLLPKLVGSFIKFRFDHPLVLQRLELVTCESIRGRIIAPIEWIMFITLYRLVTIITCLVLVRPHWQLSVLPLRLNHPLTDFTQCNLSINSPIETSKHLTHYFHGWTPQNQFFLGTDKTFVFDLSELAIGYLWQNLNNLLAYVLLSNITVVVDKYL